MFTGQWEKVPFAGESWANRYDRFSKAYLPIPTGDNDHVGNIENLWQNMRHGLTYSWPSWGIRWPIIHDEPQLSLASQIVGCWVILQVFIATLKLLLLGISWAMINAQAQQRSATQSRMRFSDLYEATFDKLWLILDISFQPTPQEWQISHQCLCTPVCSALYILVCFTLIMFSLTLNQWT